MSLNTFYQDFGPNGRRIDSQRGSAGIRRTVSRYKHSLKKSFKIGRKFAVVGLTGPANLRIRALGWGQTVNAMATTLVNSDQAQLEQTIEMFEVITQSQPHDYQSLEILKEAYAKLGREAEAVATSKRIAEAYVQMGQLSSAILEYETILQRFPDDPDVKAALARIETKANHFPVEETPTEILLAKPFSPAAAPPAAKNGAK